MIEGKIIFSNGIVYEGKFDKDTGYLVEGVTVSLDGQVTVGKWDKYTGKRVNLTKGEAFIRSAVWMTKN
jgi:hypothetical protein